MLTRLFKRDTVGTNNGIAGAMSFNEAVSARMNNAAKNWFYSTSDSPDAHSAQYRFEKKSFFPVMVSPKFKIKSSSKIYTIGSCFARNVEEYLLKAGFEVPTTKISVDPDVYVRKPRFANTILNKYNPSSMASEIMRGLGKQTFPERGIIDLGGGRFFDAQASHTGALTKEKAYNLRDTLDTVAEEIKNCDVFLMTLGLTETWWDNNTGIAFNAINPVVMRPVRDRLTFANVTADMAYQELSEALVALKEQVPSAKVVITVSPVPLTNTFTSMDVVTANTISKATLRVTAGRLSEDFEFVDYFPSFEMVVNSDRTFAWNVDQAHVTNHAVEMVISKFMEAYVGD